MNKAPALATQYIEDENGEMVKFEIGSGNVFADLGLPDADELFYKAQLAHKITDIIQSRKLTQTAAAHLTGIQQPDLSNLLQGRLDGFSAERLFSMLNRLGYGVEVRIASRPEDTTAKTLVIAA